MTKVAVVGAGLIGRAWSIVFARAGFDVALWDKFPQQVKAAMEFIADRLPELRQAGLLDDEPDTVLARIRPMQSMWEAVKDVEHVQENGPERIPEKQALFAELDRATKPDTVLAGMPLVELASSAPCRRFSANPSISFLTVAGTWPARCINARVRSTTASSVQGAGHNSTRGIR